MKIRDIVRGGVYRNGLGSERRVMREFEFNPFFSRTVTYVWVKIGPNGAGSNGKGDVGKCSASSFAQWAVERVR